AAAARLFADCVAADGVIHGFGTGHSQATVLEIVGRAGGFVPTNRIGLSDLVLRGGEDRSVLADPLLERSPGLARKLYELSAPRCCRCPTATRCAGCPRSPRRCWCRWSSPSRSACCSPRATTRRSTSRPTCPAATSATRCWRSTTPGGCTGGASDLDRGRHQLAWAWQRGRGEVDRCPKRTTRPGSTGVRSGRRSPSTARSWPTPICATCSRAT